jgi:peptidoglycan/xylan/chitin deacetylase (PgdA/CDA1 family)
MSQVQVFARPRSGAIEDVKQDEDLWNLFTKKEEYRPVQLDRYQRFISTHSRYTDLLNPRVSEYIVNQGLNVRYPEDQPFAICLTHDVDTVSPTFLQRMSNLRSPAAALSPHYLKRWLSRKGYRNFPDIMALEEEYGARSSFYFLATDKDIRRYRYRVEDLEDDMGRILDNGWEVGLHGGYYAYDNLKEMTSEKERLENVLHRKIIGYRNHYLRFKVPDTWALLEKAGFLYDTTYGYPDALGFRNGMCHPFRPYNLESQGDMSILELPLCLMDTTLGGAGMDASWPAIETMLHAVEKCRGTFVLNFHNDVFCSPMKQNSMRIYKKILQYGHEKKCWMTTGEEIFRWWVKNGY